MQHLLRNKIIYSIIVLIALSTKAFSQSSEFDYNLEDHDDKKFHFGINLGANRSFYKFTNHPRFLQYDSVLGVESIQSTGVNLAWLVNMRLGKHFDLRTYPLNLIFTEKAFEYTIKYPDRFLFEDSLTTRKVQGITLALPLQLKFSSDRIDNFKVYLIGGGRIEYDFAANAGERNAEKLIKLNKLDYGIEAGIGFHFYFPVFVLSPEVKVNWGFRNVHSRDPNLKFSNVIDQIRSRSITLSFIIE
ncbi:MAG: PorT family protein [Ferruginibacter sp.]|nr:PorT family protein [Ferruginibacter sp.]